MPSAPVPQQTVLKDAISILPDADILHAAQALLPSLVQDAHGVLVLRSALISLISMADCDRLGQTSIDLALKKTPLDPVISHEFLEQPWLSAAVKFSADHNDHNEDLLDGRRLEVPVLALRFTHDSIDSRLHFKNQMSIFKTLDDLQRGMLQPETLEEPLDVCRHDGTWYSMSNRRLFVLLMYQAVHREKVVNAPCIVRSKRWNNNKFQRAFTTENDGLGVEAHQSGTLQESLHRKRPLFDSGKSAFSLLEELLIGSEFEWVLQHVRLRTSQRQDDSHSLTLTDCTASSRTGDSEQTCSVPDQHLRRTSRSRSASKVRGHIAHMQEAEAEGSFFESAKKLTLATYAEVMHVSSHGKHELALAVSDGKVMFYDVSDAVWINSVSLPEDIQILESIAFGQYTHHDLCCVMGCISNHTIHVFCLKPYFKVLSRFDIDQGPVNSIDFHQRQTVLCTPSHGNFCKILDFVAGQTLRVFCHPCAVLGAKFLDAFSFEYCCATYASDSLVRIWDMRSRECLATSSVCISITDVDFSSVLATLAIGSTDGTITFWRIKQRPLAEDNGTDLVTVDYVVKKVAWSLSGFYLAVACSSGKIFVYKSERDFGNSSSSVSHPRKRVALVNHFSCLHSVAWVFDKGTYESILVSVQQDGTCWCWKHSEPSDATVQ